VSAGCPPERQRRRQGSDFAAAGRVMAANGGELTGGRFSRTAYRRVQVAGAQPAGKPTGALNRSAPT
jgi:hypothetical protein